MAGRLPVHWWRHKTSPAFACQPANKWLKDRVGRTLAYADIEHSTRLVAALDETAEIMETLSYK